MSRTVFRYRLEVGHDALTTFLAPADAEILSVGARGDQLSVWMLVYPTAPNDTAYHFCSHETGGAIRAEHETHHKQFLGTVSLELAFMPIYVVHVWRFE